MQQIHVFLVLKTKWKSACALPHIMSGACVLTSCAQNRLKPSLLTIKTWWRSCECCNNMLSFLWPHHCSLWLDWRHISHHMTCALIGMCQICRQPVNSCMCWYDRCILTIKMRLRPGPWIPGVRFPLVQWLINYSCALWRFCMERK